MAGDYPPDQRGWRERHPEILTAGYTIAGLLSRGAADCGRVLVYV